MIVEGRRFEGVIPCPLQNVTFERMYHCQGPWEIIDCCDIFEWLTKDGLWTMTVPVVSGILVVMTLTACFCCYCKSSCSKRRESPGSSARSALNQDRLATNGRHHDPESFAMTSGPVESHDTNDLTDFLLFSTFNRQISDSIALPLIASEFVPHAARSEEEPVF